jgi:hypothetical protein
MYSNGDVVNWAAGSNALEAKLPRLVTDLTARMGRAALSDARRASASISPQRRPVTVTTAAADAEWDRQGAPGGIHDARAYAARNRSTGYGACRHGRQLGG